MTAESVTTAAELDALPVGSVAVLADQTVIERAGLDFWLATGQTIVIWHKTVQKHVADLTIIRRPDRDLLAEAEARGARSALLSAAERLRDDLDEPWGMRAASRVERYADDEQAEVSRG